MSSRRALFWSLFWVSLAMVCYGFIYQGIGPAWLAPHMGKAKATEFLTGYIIEKSLSVDNLFVFLMLFQYFKIPASLQRRVLNWGIVGVIILRGVIILLGASLVTHFSWILVLFAFILLPAGYKMLTGDEEEESAEDLLDNWAVRTFKRFIPVTEEPDGEKFFTKRAGQWMATPLFIILLLVETSDLIFAVDSIPAIFAITTDPFIIFSSNLLAVLGLRALYFLLARVAEVFQYVKRGVGVILIFVGLKLILVPLGFHISVEVSLGAVLSILAVSMVLSYVFRPKGVSFFDEPESNL